MTGPAYPAARAIAPRVEEQFAQHVAAAGPIDTRGLTLPQAEDIEAIIDAAFWASLRREEGYVPKISLALVPPDRANRPMFFERSLPLATLALVKVAPAVERPGIHLGVWRQDGELRVWGTTRDIPIFCLVLEVVAPGLLVIKHHRGEVGKFINVAVLEGDQIKMIDETASSLPDCPSLLASLLGFDTRTWPGGRQRACRAGGLDPGARPRRVAAGRTGSGHRMARVDRASDFVLGATAVLGARRSRQSGAERAGPE